VNKNWLSSVFLLSIMISGFMIASITRFSTVQAATNVGGVISSDTVWTLTNSPYIFVGDVTIAPRVTLLIEPGVTIDFNSWSLIVEGTLYARGNENSRIKFQSSEKIVGAWPPRIYFNDTSTWWNVNTGTGCIIEYAEINVSNFQYETIMGGYPKISNNLIFNYGNDAAAVRTNGLVINNTILGGWYGIVAENGTILQNTVIDTDGGGILCGFISTDPIYHPTIIGNLVANNSVGIYVSSCSPYIANNTIVNNTRGIRFDYYAFSRNAVPAGIIYNNLDGNNYAVFVEYEDPQISINMTYNWWGTTNASLIDQKIYDQKDNSGLSLVNYVPFLTAPAILLPDLIPLPTPSSSPMPTPSPDNQTISRIQSYQYGVGLGMGNEPSVQTSITLANAPIQGDVLISVIGIQGQHTTVTDAQGMVTAPLSFETATVSSINETGVVWARQVRSNSTAFNLNMEVWLGVVVSQASPTITVNLDSLPSNMIMALTIDICEYNGIAANSSLDKTAINTGFGSTADTGLTAPTTQPNELWIGAILFQSPGQQKSPTNGFLLLDGQPNATGGRQSTAFLEKIVNEQGTANSGTTIKHGDEILFGAWVGCVATFSSTPVDAPTSTPSSSNGTGWDIFSVESNSTVTELAFNSTGSELTFVVNGPSGTAGYVKVTIAKSIVANAENIKVSLDGTQLNYEITSNANAWLLTFTYMHSTHQVRINLAANAATTTLPGIEFWIGLGAVIVIVVIGACLLLYSKKRKR
jgi:parallel beta-helix repeat protein